MRSRAVRAVQYVLILLCAPFAVGADGRSETPVYLEGTFTFEVIGPGAAPYGISSGILGAMGVGINLGRLERMQLPINPGLDTDEHTRIDIDFMLAPKSKARWELFEYSVYHTAEDFTTLEEEGNRIADSLTCSDEARYSDGKWIVAPEGIPKDFKPLIRLKTWRAETTAACESGPGWLPAIFSRSGEVLCYELELDLIYPVAPVGTSEWIKDGKFGVRLRTQEGIYKFSMEAPEIPDISGLLPDRDDSVAAIETLAEFFSELVGQATGSQHQKPNIDPSQVQDIQKNVRDLLRGVEAMRDQFEQLEVDLRSGHSLQRTWRGVVENGLIRIDDVYPILSGGEASDLGRLPVLYPYLEKVDEDWLPEDGNSVKVAAGIEGAVTGPMDWRFELMEVTTEKGECLNSQSRDAEPDLFFDDRINAALGLTAAQKVGAMWRVETTEPQEKVTLWVASRDYGAWGKLKAWVKMGDDWQPVAVEGSELDYITIPLDESGAENFIADAWERAEGLSPGQDHRLDDDEEGPKNQHRGDGLSLYEEYRGILVKGDHFRTHPTHKDLFIHIQPGVGMDGYGNYFLKAAGTAVHELSQEEFFSSRNSQVINRNSSPDKRWAPGHRQNGIYIRVQNNNQLPELCGVGVAEKHLVVISNTEECKVEHIFNHELMHAVQVKHHGWVNPRHMIKVCLGTDNKYYPDCEAHPGIETTVGIAYWDSPYSGDQWCFMAYHDGAVGFTDSRTRNHPVLDPAGHLIVFEHPMEKDHICKSQEGTAYNENGQQVNGASKDFGNCWDQIRIRDEE